MHIESKISNRVTVVHRGKKAALCADRRDTSKGSILRSMGRCFSRSMDLLLDSPKVTDHPHQNKGMTSLYSLSNSDITHHIRIGTKTITTGGTAIITTIEKVTGTNSGNRPR